MSLFFSNRNYEMIKMLKINVSTKWSITFSDEKLIYESYLNIVRQITFYIPELSMIITSIVEKNLKEKELSPFIMFLDLMYVVEGEEQKVTWRRWEGRRVHKLTLCHLHCSL